MGKHCPRPSVVGVMHPAGSQAQLACVLSDTDNNNSQASLVLPDIPVSTRPFSVV